MSEFNQHDQGGAAVLDERKEGKGRRHATHAESHPTVAFSLPTARLVPCAIKAVSAVILGGLSAFLISEIPETPGLLTNIVILSTIGVIGSVALAFLAYRDAVRRLVVDDRGLHITPFPFGRSIEWSQVASWRMSDEPDDHADERQLMLWIQEASFPQLIPVGRLSRDAYRSLRKALHVRLGGEC